MDWAAWVPRQDTPVCKSPSPENTNSDGKDNSLLRTLSLALYRLKLNWSLGDSERPAYGDLLPKPASENVLRTLMHLAESTLERDHFKGPEESKEFGLIDQVVSKRDMQPPGAGLWA